ncbi:MAG: class B sortase [Clostridiales bacterium]|jgi:hypothetical protein|nr:class B sortase [Clostridiales bacterium]
MKSGKMFCALESCKDADFWREHPFIHFDASARFGVYEILAVFKANSADFPYHEIVNLDDEAEFEEFVSHCKAISFYDAVAIAVYGDKLITLSI